MGTLWTWIIFGLAIATSIKFKVWWLWMIMIIAFAIGVIFGHSIGAFAAMFVGLIAPPLIRWGKRKSHELDPGDPRSSKEHHSGPNTSY